MEKTNTKHRLVTIAHQKFAEHGFDGVSIAEIAQEAGVTKQALLHHFGSKEKLYGNVLQALSDRFERILDKHVQDAPPAISQFRLIMQELYQYLQSEKHDARLIVRELLDNKPRIESKQIWYMRPFLDRLTDLVLQASQNSSLKRTEAFARVFQIIGAVNYFAISDPTLQKMYGADSYRELEEVYLDQLERMTGML